MKIRLGRQDGVQVEQMRSFTAKELNAVADWYEKKSNDPKDKDHPDWCRQRAGKLRAMAAKKHYWGYSRK
jgi:hypothetical protein